MLITVRSLYLTLQAAPLAQALPCLKYHTGNSLYEASTTPWRPSFVQVISQSTGEPKDTETYTNFYGYEGTKQYPVLFDPEPCSAFRSAQEISY